MSTSQRLTENKYCPAHLSMNMKVISEIEGIPDSWYEKQFWHTLNCMGCKDPVDHREQYYFCQFDKCRIWLCSKCQIRYLGMKKKKTKYDQNLPPVLYLYLEKQSENKF